MVDSEVRKETKRILLEMFDGDTEAMLDHVFRTTVLDVNKCRIAIIKRYYYELCKTMTAAQAKELTAEKFFRSEKTIENIIYNPFYKAIKIVSCNSTAYICKRINYTHEQAVLSHHEQVRRRP